MIRSKSQDQCGSGNPDLIDAEAARAVLASAATGAPKGADGEVGMIRALRITRRSALKAGTQAVNHMKALLVPAPEKSRAELCQLSTSKLVKRAARFRLGQCPDDVTPATKFALRSGACRYLQLSEEISDLDEQLDRLVAEAAPESITIEGVGTDTVASLLIVAGDNP